MTCDVVADARWEYSRTGTLRVSTFARLTNEGYDAEILMAQFEAAKDDAYPEGYGTGEK
jgi:hypothetical protein